MACEKELRVAKQLAVDAGKLVKKLASGQLEIKFKGPVDLVTKADVESEKLIINQIKENFPGHAILSEEAEQDQAKEALKYNTSGQAEYLWLIDPLDGTTNYAHGFSVYAVSIALAHQGEIVVGVVYEPNLAELFTAAKGGGAYLNDKPISVSKISELNKSLLATGFPYNLRKRPKEVLGYFDAFTLRAQGVRRAGAAAVDLCQLACGRFDGFWELGLKPWDTAAGKLIVSEAGGKLTKFDSSPFDIWTPEVVATNGLIHEQMLEVLNA